MQLMITTNKSKEITPTVGDCTRAYPITDPSFYGCFFKAARKRMEAWLYHPPEESGERLGKQGDRHGFT